MTLLNFCSLKILESLISRPACSASVVHQENSQPPSMFTLQETLLSSIPCHSCKRIFTLPHSQVCALKYFSNKKTDDLCPASGSVSVIVSTLNLSYHRKMCACDAYTVLSNNSNLSMIKMVRNNLACMYPRSLL